MITRYEHLNSRLVLGRLPSPLETFVSSVHTDSPPEEKLTIGYAGRFVHGKDLGVALNPLQKLLEKKGTSVQLEFIDCIPEELRSHPQVKSTPFFSNIADFYQYMVHAAMVYRPCFTGG